MPNDDLGTFPMPPQTPTDQPVPDQPSTPSSDSAPLVSDNLLNTAQATPPIIPEPKIISDTQNEVPTAPFEETPDELPTIPQPSPTLMTEQEKLVDVNEDMIDRQNISEEPQPEPTPPSPPQPVTTPVEAPATLPAKNNRSVSLVVITVLVVIAGIGIAAAAYLSQQTSKLKTQLQEITQTLEKQETTLTPTPTPTVFEALTPTPEASPSGIPATPSANPTISITTGKIQPLANAASALKVAINHSPNAQLILIKEDHTADLTTAITKYFFREDLTTKKYFYVAISGTGSPETIDKQIYVTPDDNIPSLNDTVLSNKLGLDLDEALKLTYTQCANQEACTSAPVKAQYIKTGSGIIWQISLYTKGTSSSPLLIQINAETKAIIYKSPEFANK